MSSNLIYKPKNGNYRCIIYADRNINSFCRHKAAFWGQVRPGANVTPKRVCSPAAASAEVLWAASPEETTATLSIGVPLDTEAAVGAGAAAEALMDGARALFFGATMTLLLKDHMTQITETLKPWPSLKLSLIKVFFLTINHRAACCNYSTTNRPFIL